MEEFLCSVHVWWELAIEGVFVQALCIASDFFLLRVIPAPFVCRLCLCDCVILCCLCPTLSLHESSDNGAPDRCVPLQRRDEGPDDSLMAGIPTFVDLAENGKILTVDEAMDLLPGESSCRSHWDPFLDGPLCARSWRWRRRWIFCPECLVVVRMVELSFADLALGSFCRPLNLPASCSCDSKRDSLALSALPTHSR